MQCSHVLELTNLGLLSKLMFGKELTWVQFRQNPYYYCTLEGVGNKFYFENKLQLQQVHNHEVFKNCD